MKKLYWIFPVLMLLVAGENLYWDSVYGDFAVVCYPVMGLLILLGALLGIRLQKTGKRKFLVLMILVFVLYLLIAVFRVNLQAFYEDLMRKIMRLIFSGWWTPPLQKGWK